ncbi:hypothetical protein GCM10008967_24400 [Bacillus carboniphilus]|uniref:FtsK domain-containing protein n=1 Tax=Bacillus carboniphilus TaxID=86663 RepID=A0ABN0WCJ1_9BACI
MNFFNKWIKKLKNNEEERPVTEEMKRVSSLPSSHEQGRGKEVEARITYQYPKGQFRFPLIPDEDVKRKRASERRESRIEDRRRNKSIQPEQVETAKVELEIKKVKEVKKGPKKPFSPTEIPSPIYGFREREYKKSSVDYDIRDFTPRKPIESQPEDTYEKGFFTEILGEENIIEKDESTPVIEDVIEDKVEEKLVESVHLVEDEPKRESELSYLENDLDFSDEEDTAPLMHEEPYLDESESKFILDEHNGIEESIEPESGLAIDIEEEQLPILEEKVQEETTGGQEDLAVETSQPKTESTRPHLPFNVLMLKQDKKKWEMKQHHVKEEPKVTLENPKVDEKVKVEKEIQPSESMVEDDYYFPSQHLLTPPAEEAEQGEWIENQANILDQTLKHFHVKANVVAYSQGPSVTRFEVQPEPGVKVNKITNLMDDLKLSLAAKDIRMEAPIPGKHTIGIEIPNQKARPVHLRELTEHPKFQESQSPLTVALGLDISGEPIMTDLKKMPHGLIAGATGSGKSVCINSILVSLMYKAHPDQVKLLLIDPKMVELTPYNGIPHLVAPVITDVKAATTSLKWAVQEMESRYDEFAKTGVRDIERYNTLYPDNHLPYVVIIIDELADLMMVAPGDVEDAICRIAQKARACGIHLIIATQRPSVDVITGLIKANVPTRIAFSVSSQVDSRTIIDTSGAERLLGKGDMLFLENGASKPVRLQGTFVSDVEIDAVVEHVSFQQEPDYLFHQEELLQKAQIADEEDELFMEACQFVVEQGNASTSLLQRRFRIGYNRAARLIEMLENQGIVSEAKGTKPRDVLISEEGLSSYQSE